MWTVRLFSLDKLAIIHSMEFSVCPRTEMDIAGKSLIRLPVCLTMLTHYSLLDYEVAPKFQ